MVIDDKTKKVSQSFYLNIGKFIYDKANESSGILLKGSLD